MSADVIAANELRGRNRDLTKDNKRGYTKAMENSQIDLQKASDELETQEKPLMPQDFYSVSDVAELVGVSRQRIHQIIDDGGLKPDIITRFEFLFRRKTVDRFKKKFKRRAW